MKINESNYLCDWCREEINQIVGRVTGNGKHTFPNQLVCPKCNRYVSQKTKLEMEAKK